MSDDQAGAPKLQRHPVEAGPTSLRLTGLPGIPVIGPGADLAGLIRSAAERAGTVCNDGVLVVCQKVVSKAEGQLVRLEDIAPSDAARKIAMEDDKDPRHIELILRESVRIVRRGHGVLICETRHGFVCANAGVDLSNAPAEDVAVLLPVDPDGSAERLRAALLSKGGRLGVVISDTFGRPWREGLVDLAIGCAGFAPLADFRGQHDLMGRELQVTAYATADQLAAAVGLLMGKDSGVPAVWIEGIEPRGNGRARELLRDASLDLFR